MRFVARFASLAAVVLAALAARAQEHPRLMVDAAGFETLRALSAPAGPSGEWTEPETLAVLARRAVVSAAESALFHAPDDPWWSDPGSQGMPSSALHGLGMAFQLTGDVRYRDHGIDLLTTWAAIGHPRWDDPNPLGLGDLLAGVAVGVDWLWDEMTVAQQDEQIAVLVALSDELRAHPGLSTQFWERGHDWNWTGVVAGGLGLAQIALDGHLSGAEEDARADRLDEVVALLGGYFDWGFDASGAVLEGALYGNYGTHNALPVAITLDRLGDDRIGIRERHVVRAADWLVYDQLPYDARRFTLVNDTGEDSGGLQYQIFGFPLLLGLWPAGSPVATSHLYDTFFQGLQSWDESAAGSGTPFSPWKSSTFVLVALVGGLPPPESRAHPPTDFRGGKWFERGTTVVRTGFHDVDSAGHTVLHEGGQGTLVVFESREPPPWAEEDASFYDGHAQFDCNQFLVYALGAPLFYDGGYGAWEAEHHNLHSIDGQGPSDLGWTNRVGGVERFVWARGNAPAVTTGDASATWRHPDGPAADLARWAKRHLFVLPRESGTPSLFLFDDLAISGGPREVEWYWHAGPDAADFAVDGTRATSTSGGATAASTILSPAAPTFESTRWDPGGDGESSGDHFRLATKLGPRENADLAVLVDVHPTGSDAALAATDLGLPDGTFGWTIADGERLDLVAVRRDDETGTWAFDALGHAVETDARLVVLRFDGAPGFDAIDAGLFGGGSEVTWDGEVVMALEGAVGDMTFSTDEVAIDADGVTGWVVGPVEPAGSWVNGVETPPEGGDADSDSDADADAGEGDFDGGCGCETARGGEVPAASLAVLGAILALRVGSARRVSASRRVVRSRAR